MLPCAQVEELKSKEEEEEEEGGEEEEEEQKKRCSERERDRERERSGRRKRSRRRGVLAVVSLASRWMMVEAGGWRTWAEEL